GKKRDKAVLDAMLAAQTVLERGNTIYSSIESEKLEMEHLQELNLLTAKPFIYVFNSDDEVLADEAHQQELRDLVAPAHAVFLNAQLVTDIVSFFWYAVQHMLVMEAKEE